MLWRTASVLALIALVALALAGAIDPLQSGALTMLPARAFAPPATPERRGEDRRARASLRICGARRAVDCRGAGWPRAAARARGPALGRSRFERPAVRVSTARPRRAGQVNDAARPLVGRVDSDRGVAIMFNPHRPTCAIAHAPS
jgi:hypothetical protein